uniref:Reverse transcriptase domain-containing protein n=1 Tax=Oreochromis niloticus TaxID=8128 RepID=A0A669B7W6_ORENI
MAPSVTARRLPVPICFLFMLLVVSLLVLKTHSLLVYERQMLLNIRDSLPKFPSINEQCGGLPPPLVSIPEELHRCDPPWTPSKRKRWINGRRRGTRSGKRVRVRARMRWAFTIGDPRCLGPYSGLKQRCLLPVYPTSSEHAHRMLLYWPLRRRDAREGGVNINNLQLLPATTDGQRINLALLNTRSVSNKTHVLRDFFDTYKLDIMLLTETWLRVGEVAPLLDLCPTDASFFSSPRLSGRGGGVASIIKSCFKCKQIQSPGVFTSFESQLLILNCPVVLIIVIYRPPKYNDLFISEFSDFLTCFIVHYERILIVGDFNIHLCCEDKPLVKDFLNIIDSLNFTQLMSGPTRMGHTLDLVLGYGLNISMTENCLLPILDHSAILFDILIPKSPAFERGKLPLRSSRFISPEALLGVKLHLPEVLDPIFTQGLCVDSLTVNLNNTLLELLDSVAPVKKLKCQKKNPMPWLNEELLNLRRNCRKAERHWRSSRLEVFLRAWKDSLTSFQSAMSTAKANYFSNLIMSHKHNSKLLFNTVSQLTESKSTLCCSNLMAHDFLVFFSDRADTLRNQIIPSSGSLSDYSDVLPVAADKLFSDFKVISLSELTKVVKAARSTTCSLDPLPAWAIKELWSALGPYILFLLNISLMTGVFPECYKSAVVVPILKKPGLDVDMVANYRPISHLSFLSKVFEKVVFKQLTEHLSTSNLFEPFQSAFRPNHSTETALLKVVNDLLVHADNDRTSVLLLLDLSAAFDTVDHGILLDRLEHFIGITGNVLSWLRSYLSGRSQTVNFNNVLSETCVVRHGVPQGSVLGPLLFSMYLSPLGALLRSFKVTFHCYADDLQLYVPLIIGNCTEISKLESCLSAIKGWLSDNFLCLNTDKTELMVIGPPKFQHSSQNFTLRIDDRVITCRDKVKNLGVWFDTVLSFESHIKEITKTAFYHLRNIARIRHVLSNDTAEILVHAFVSSRIDYCNALFSGLPKKSFKGLQMVQNAAARILT